MECPKGTMCTETNHSVKTLKKAKEWFEDVTEQDLPIRVQQHIGRGGRLHINVYNNHGQRLTQRG